MPSNKTRISILLIAVALVAAFTMAQTFVPTGLGIGAQNAAPPGYAGPGVLPGPRWVQPTAATGAAIQMAIESAYRTGARVYLPGGTYLIGDGGGGQDQTPHPLMHVGSNVVVSIRNSQISRTSASPLAEVKGSADYPAVLLVDNCDPNIDFSQSKIVERNARGRIRVSPAVPAEIPPVGQ